MKIRVFCASLSWLVLLAACSAPTQEQASTTTTMADTAAHAPAAPSRPARPATPATAPDTAAAPAAPSTAATPLPAASPDSAQVQAVADFLAGLPPVAGTPEAALAAAPAWHTFAQQQDKSWAKYTATHTTPMSHWAGTELDSVRQATRTVFYPFSGPDLLNVHTMFPEAATYVLVGLEPVGTLPTATTLQNPALLTAVNKSLWSVLNFSFFRTNDMAVDLKSVNLDGAVPLLALFAARTGQQVLAVRPVHLDAQGRLQPGSDSTQAGPRDIPGAELLLRDATGRAKAVYYFSADLSDWKLSTKDAPLRYVRSLGPLTTYVKSATYLMHKSYFSRIRNLVLERSNYLLQDDSGIAMKYFPRSAWQFTYYGTYKRPINLFAKQYQPELTAAYHDSLRRARPLPFGTGYNWRQTDSNLLLARRRTPLAE